MTSLPSSLLQALQSADMLFINDLHAWQFSLAPEALEHVQADLLAAGAAEQPLLKIECMDGRTRRVWTFSTASVLAAKLEPAGQHWLVQDTNGEQRISCIEAICASNEDDESAAVANDA
jgi:hypothetical protein